MPRKATPGSFRSGPDSRRHVFTQEERSRGGRTSWARMLPEVRLSMSVPLPTEKVREQAKKILEKRRGP